MRVNGVKGGGAAFFTSLFILALRVSPEVAIGAGKVGRGVGWLKQRAASELA